MSSGRSIKLNSGYSMPVVGLGTWQSAPNEVAHAVEYALKHGYRHIDAAAVYDNEKEVGAGIKASGVDRSDIFLTSKLWNTHHRGEDVQEAVKQSLEDLGTDYLDLYLIHWPVTFKEDPQNPSNRNPVNPTDGGIHAVQNVPVEETWKALETLVDKGLVRSIGISNFNKEKTEELLQIARIKPAVHQIEGHPYFQQPKLVEWYKQQGMSVTVYSPSDNNIYGLSKPVDDPEVLSVAQELAKSPAQVLIQWAAQRGTVVLPKSVTPHRIAENFEDFELSQQQMDRINALDRNHRYNMPLKWGVDIFAEHDAEVLQQGRQQWIAQQEK